MVLLFTDGVDNPGISRRTISARWTHGSGDQREDVIVAIGLESRTPPMGGGGAGSAAGLGRQVRRPAAETHGHSASRSGAAGTIAAETGGGYFELRRADDLRARSRAWPRNCTAIRAWIRPTKLDGKTHELEVKVKKSGMKVRARKSYVASK